MLSLSMMAATPIASSLPLQHLLRRFGKTNSHVVKYFGTFQVPHEIKNEPLKKYEIGSSERLNLREAVERLYQSSPEIPCIVGGKDIFTGEIEFQQMPTEHRKKLCKFHKASEVVVKQAISECATAKPAWENLPIEERTSVFLKAADLLSGKYRAEMAASMMLGMGKNVWQAEIDLAEMIDFWRLNARYAHEIYRQQPAFNDSGIWNRTEYRALEGFILAVSPFNFAAIGSNLHSSPAQ